MEYNMHLNEVYFDKVVNGNKTIELRLNDEKRSKINVGDTITFKNRSNDDTVSVVVTNIYHYDNFEELYKHTDKLKIGYSEDDIASPADMNTIYSNEQQMKYGVVAIEFKLK